MMRGLKRITAFLITLVMTVSLLPVSASIDGMSKGSLEVWYWQSNFTESEIYVDGSPGVLGKGSLTLHTKKLNPTNAGYFWTEYYINAKKGQTFTIEFSAKMRNGASDSYMRFNWDRMNLVTGAKTFDWTEYKRSYTATADGSLAIGFGFAGKNEDEQLWIDNIKLYDIKNPGVNLIPNGNFEASTPVIKNTFQEEEVVVEEPVAEDDRDLYASKKTMTVDGKFDDWDGIEAREMHYLDRLIEPIGQLIKSNIRLAYDEENLYFAVEVTDDVHYTTGTYWQGDSLQFAFSQAEAVALRKLTERGIAFDEAENKIRKANGEDFDAAVTREGNKTRYEAAVPWDIGFGGEVPGTLRFNVTINNNDGNGRMLALSITNGIVMTKNADFYKFTYIWKPVGEVEYSLGIPGNMTIGTEEATKVNILNSSGKDQTVKVSIPKLNFERTVTIKPGEEKNFATMVKATGRENINYTIKIENNGQVIEKDCTVKTKVVYQEPEFQEFMKRLTAWEAELKELIYQCEQKGMSVDYEVADYTIISKMLTDYIPYEVNVSNAKRGYQRMYHIDKALTELYERSSKALKAYLSGEKKPLAVPRYVTSDLRFDGPTIYGQTITDGVMEERPVFLIGWGHFNTPHTEMPMLSNLGASFTQIEMLMWDMISPIRGNAWTHYVNRESSGSIHQTKEDAASGEYSIKMQKSADPVQNVFLQLRQQIPVKPNTTYVFGYKAKGKGITKDQAWVDFARQNWGQTRPAIPDSSDWKSYEYETTTNGTDEMFWLLVHLGGGVEECWIDDIYVYEKGTDINLAKNGSFDDNPPYRTELEERIGEEKEWYINWEFVEKWEQILAEAEKHNIQIGWMPGVSHMPMFIRELEPEIEVVKPKFLPLAVDHPTPLKLVDVVSQIMGDLIAKYNSVHVCDMTNESRVYGNDISGHYKPLWKEYLMGIYDTIEDLNANVGTDYKSFDEVPMTQGPDGTPLSNDYLNFNDNLLAGFHKKMNDIIKKNIPGIKTFAKYIAYYSPTAVIDRGNDYELLAEFTDINGCDNLPTFGSMENSLLNIQAWYDLQRSMGNKPSFNTEHHHVPDGKNIYEGDDAYDLLKNYVGGDLWSGAIRGRTGSVIWLWEDVRETSAFDGTNGRNRPEIAADVARTSFDLNRLGKEIAAFHKVEPKIAVIYSRTALAFNYNKHINDCINAYEETVFNGQMARFVIDSKPEDIHKYKLVIVPSASHLDDKMMAEIKKYVENGGKLLLTGEESFYYDEYKHPRDKELIDYLYKNADTTSTVTEKIAEMGFSDVMLIDVKTGKKPEKNIEWFTTEYEGKTLVHIMSYETDKDVTLKIVKNGQEVTEFTELRSTDVLKDTVTIHPHSPILLQF